MADLSGDERICGRIMPHFAGVVKRSFRQVFMESIKMCFRILWV